MLAECQFKCLRKHSYADDYASTAASTTVASPELSPQWGPSTPLCGPGELLLQDLPEFELPDAEGDSSDGSMDFELTGLDDNLNELQDVFAAGNLQTMQDSEETEADLDGLDEEMSSVLSALADLSTARAELTAAEKAHEAAASAPPPRGAVEVQLYFRQLLALPGFQSVPSWMVPPGCAQTGHAAHAIAPRPSECCWEPLSVHLGPGGVLLEAASGPAEEWVRAERKMSLELQATQRRSSRGRSRSPSPIDDMVQELPSGCLRGRANTR